MLAAATIETTKRNMGATSQERLRIPVRDLLIACEQDGRPRGADRNSWEFNPSEPGERAFGGARIAGCAASGEELSAWAAALGGGRPAQSRVVSAPAAACSGTARSGPSGTGSWD